MFHTISQFIILILGAVSIYLISSKYKRYRLTGFIINLFYQPLFICSVLYHKQYGMLILSLWYTFSLIRGIKNNLKRKTK
jgi:hypothetical protein